MIILRGCKYDKVHKVVYCTHNEGFFSNCTLTLWTLIELLNRGEFPVKIDFSRGFAPYQLPEFRQDLYLEYFEEKRNPRGYFKNKRMSLFNHHGSYNTIPFEDYSLLVDKYFHPSKHVIEFVKSTLSKYSLNLAETIFVYYRGTDKSKEVKLVEVEKYIDLTRRILDSNQNYKVLIQTDQSQIRNKFVKEFNQKCIFINELSVSSGNVGIHLNNQNSAKENSEEMKILLATIYFFSKSSFIICSTSNVSIWLLLFRGSSENVFQFNKNGSLLFGKPNLIAKIYSTITIRVMRMKLILLGFVKKLKLTGIFKK